MVKIKEIKKIGPKIKEIEPVNKSESSLEEEVSEADSENFASFIGGRRRNQTSTLVQSEAPQERIERVIPLAKEEDDETHFRPSYVGSGGNPYQGRSYSSQMEQGTSGMNSRGEARGDVSPTLRQESTQSTVMAGMGSPPSLNEGRGAGRMEQEGGHQYTEGVKKEKRSKM